MFKSKSDLLNLVNQSIRGESTALMLFGSVARGDANLYSDVDILQLVSSYIPSYKKGKFNFSVYTESSLQNIARQGSLFVLHLKMEGVFLDDRNHVLSKILSEYDKPKSYDGILADLRIAVDYLNVSTANYFGAWKAWNSVALFILRTTLYTLAAEAGRPQFSIEQVAKANNDKRIISVCKLKYSSKPKYELFRLCCNLTLEYLRVNFTVPPDSLAFLMSKPMRQSPLLDSITSQLMGRNQGRAGAYG